jgi:hypothetical protein
MFTGRIFLRKSLWIAVACAAMVVWWKFSGIDRTKTVAVENTIPDADLQAPLLTRHFWDLIAAVRH